MSSKSLQKILDDISFEDALPGEWYLRSEYLKQFSEKKTLFDFQIKALENTLKTLFLYYGQDETDAELGKFMHNLYQGNNIESVNNRNDTNQASFWMATGSGKTLVIVKIIEILGILMARGVIPTKDIMFLVHRDNLLNQLKTHIDEYNSFNIEQKINLIELRNYERVKHENVRPYSNNEISVFYHRADLFFETSKVKKISVHNCDNNGKWFVLLDEAHRGDRNESKYKEIYSRFSRNGFLFNFSATFTDSIDIATCAFNFNLEKFIQNGYGKNIYVSEENIEGFREVSEFSESEKQKIVLKTLVLQTYINRHYKKLKQKMDAPYHKPLLLTITNTVNEISGKNKNVNKMKSDLRLFFSELEKIASGKVDENLLIEAKDSIKVEMADGKYLFGEESLQINAKQINNLQCKDILKEVFNTKTAGKIEVISISGNKQEIIFKMMTSSKPFALIRIGDTKKWINEILEGYEITKHYENDGYFNKLNDPESDINILMGSRTFYEGWDSNRPNIILFINIGLGKDSKKFVLQSVGRGVRIEPQKNKRMRIKNLHNSQEISAELFESVKNNVAPLETLFVLGTDAQNLKNIIVSLKSEGSQKTFDIGTEFILNPTIKDTLFLIPEYSDSDKSMPEIAGDYSIKISEEDLAAANNMLNMLSNKVLLMQYRYAHPQVLPELRNKMPILKSNGEVRNINNPEFSMGKIIDYFNTKSKIFSRFKTVEDTIVHFRKIQFTGTEAERDELVSRIKIMQDYPQKYAETEDLFAANSRKNYDEKNALLLAAKTFSPDDSKKCVDIKYIAHHYYHPLLVSNTDKINYLTHIIDVESEVKFITLLENAENSFNELDWWMFSKIDETLDSDVYIPYYNHKRGGLAKFHPDFIFWLKQGNNYSIVFIDPKGSAHTDYQHKADGYKSFFKEKETNIEKSFSQHGLNIKVYLRFFGRDVLDTAEGYRDYWIDQADDIVALARLS